FSSRRRHTRSKRDWSSDVCSSDLAFGHYWIVAITVEAARQSPSLASNLIVPVRGALMADSIFIASTVAIASPSDTEAPSETFQATRFASKGEVTDPSPGVAAPFAFEVGVASGLLFDAGAVKSSTGRPTLTSLPPISTATLWRWA